MARRIYDRTLPQHPGTKNRQVTVQTWTAGSPSLDDYGQSSGSWEDLTDGTVWASVRQLSSRMAEYAHQFYEIATHRVLIDYRTDITPGATADRLRVVYGSRVFYVGYVNELGDARVTLELLCSEGAQ